MAMQNPQEVEVVLGARSPCKYSHCAAPPNHLPSFDCHHHHQHHHPDQRFLLPRCLLHPPYVYPPYDEQLLSDVRMAAAPSADEMAELQRLSNEYDPDVQGPFVGPKQSSLALTAEYLQADPIYRAKTAALARSHSHYRVMKGDGNCGWRAVAFGYFENLFLLQDTARVAQELTRIKGFNSLLNAVGHDESLYEIFVDATEALLNQTSEEIDKGSQDISFLEEAFNVEYNSNAIITHFRLMTSAWMKLNADRYQAFLPAPVDGYCATTIETVKTEIDEVGLQALVDGVIQGSGFGVEILYLDRSDGTEANPHILGPGVEGLATIRLLYRPGHYDLLYQTAPQSTETLVNNLTATSPPCVPPGQTPARLDFDPMLITIPNVTRQTHNHPPFPCGEGPYAFPVQTSPVSPNQPHNTPTSLPPVCRPDTSPAPELNNATDTSSELRIRMTSWTYGPFRTLPLGSMPVRNAQKSVAHFQNPRFQPSQWDPSEVYK